MKSAITIHTMKSIEKWLGVANKQMNGTEQMTECCKGILSSLLFICMWHLYMRTHENKQWKIAGSQKQIRSKNFANATACICLFACLLGFHFVGRVCAIVCVWICFCVCVYEFCVSCIPFVWLHYFVDRISAKQCAK